MAKFNVVRAPVVRPAISHVTIELRASEWYHVQDLVDSVNVNVGDKLAAAGDSFSVPDFIDRLDRLVAKVSE